jgi:hypothetical protein
MFKFVVTFASCFTMGKAHKWDIHKMKGLTWLLCCPKPRILRMSLPWGFTLHFEFFFIEFKVSNPCHESSKCCSALEWKLGFKQIFIRYWCLYTIWCSVNWEWIFTWWMIMKMMPVLRALDEGSTPNALFWCKSSSPKAQYTATECGIVMDNT